MKSLKICHEFFQYTQLLFLTSTMYGINLTNTVSNMLADIQGERTVLSALRSAHDFILF